MLPLEGKHEMLVHSSRLGGAAEASGGAALEQLASLHADTTLGANEASLVHSAFWAACGVEIGVKHGAGAAPMQVSSTAMG